MAGMTDAVFSSVISNALSQVFKNSSIADWDLVALHTHCILIFWNEFKGILQVYQALKKLISPYFTMLTMLSRVE